MSSSSSSATAASIRKTAYDALQAKHSAFILAAGHRPLFLGASSNETVDAASAKQYCDLLTTYCGMTMTTTKTSTVKTNKKGIKQQQRRRQTPLVNAGYAHRVSCILLGIRQFLQFHATEPVINVLVLGAGMDVTGLWAAAISSATNSQQQQQQQIRHVIEVDQVEICAAKRERLLVQKLVHVNNLTENKNGESSSPSPSRADAETSGSACFIHKARIPQATSSTTKSTYTLVAADLRQLDQLEQVLLPLLVNHKIDGTTTIPTLIVSELVLSYLSQSQQQALLQWCAQHLLLHPGSALLAYEALGPTENETTTTTSSNVLQNYQHAYRNQFAEKLGRGQAKTEVSSDDSVSDGNQNRSNHTTPTTELFVPVGPSCEQIQKVWQRHCGFGHVHATTAGNAAWWYRTVVRTDNNNSNNKMAPAAAAAAAAATTTMTTSELFDEHAALTLHLQSYVVVWAFAAETTAQNLKDTAYLFRRWTCPWTTASLARHLSLSCHMWLTIVEPCDEMSIRALYKQSYRQYVEEYTSIRKMVQTSLRKDLALSTSDKDKNGDFDADVFSSIRQAYLEQGGDFWVVIRQTDEATTTTETSSCRIVVGGIGLRRCSPTEEMARRAALENASSFLLHETCYYEIHRLFVREENRGRGIASALVQHAAEWALQKSPSAIALLATTPSILEHANHFYESRGFSLLHSQQVGELLMRTYINHANKQL